MRYRADHTADESARRIPDDDASSDEAGDFEAYDQEGTWIDDATLTRLREREVYLLIRQSTSYGKVKNVGSAVVQRDQARYVAPFGIRMQDIRVVDARGESARAGANRAAFEQLVAAAEAGRVGALLLGRHDRPSRNTGDSERLWAALAKSRSLVIVDGRCYDIRRPADKLNLKLLSAVAEFENDARTRWMQLARWALVRRGRFRIRLPAGLVWASPHDPYYEAAAERAGLSGWVERARSDFARYRVRSVHAPYRRLAGSRVAGLLDSSEALDLEGELDSLDGTTPTSHGGWSAGGSAGGSNAMPRGGGRWLVPLPFPDAEVVRAVLLRLQWARETGSVSAVLRRIERAPEWPRPGLVPVPAPHLWYPGHEVRWIATGQTTLGRWLLNPALYGTYTAQTESLDPRTPPSRSSA